MTEPEPAEPTEPAWNDDPLWTLVWADDDWWEQRGENTPRRPPATAERAQPPIWATLYDGNRQVATWYLRARPMTAAEPDATVGA